MLYYSYCPECGQEIGPFRTEPEDGTPMRCPYCKLVYPYKTRHWMMQRITLRIFLLVVLFVVCIRGCVGGCEKKARREDARRPEPVVINYEKMDLRRGFAHGYEWGSKWDGGIGERELKFEYGCSWDKVKLVYGENGLESFTMIADGVEANFAMKMVRDTLRGLHKNISFESCQDYRNGKERACVYKPNKEISMVCECEILDNGRHVNYRLKVTNTKVAGRVIDYAGMLKRRGWVEDD